MDGACRHDLPVQGLLGRHVLVERLLQPTSGDRGSHGDGPQWHALRPADGPRGGRACAGTGRHGGANALSSGPASLKAGRVRRRQDFHREPRFADEVAPVGADDGLAEAAASAVERPTVQDAVLMETRTTSTRMRTSTTNKGQLPRFKLRKGMTQRIDQGLMSLLLKYADKPLFKGIFPCTLQIAGCRSEQAALIVKGFKKCG